MEKTDYTTRFNEKNCMSISLYFSKKSKGNGDTGMPHK